MFTFPTQYTDINNVVRDFGPSRPIGEGFESNDLIQQYDSGTEQRRKKSDIKQVFDLNYIVIEFEAYKVLKSFFIARGTVQAFNWVHPVSKEAFVVRFNGPLQGKNIEHNAKTSLWECSVKLKQDF